MAGTMSDVSTDQLKRVIESHHGGKATFRRSMRLFPAAKSLANWDGIVHVFDLKDHPKTKRAYAWSSSIKGGTKPRYFAVLHMGPVTGPVEAVKAAVTAIRNAGSRNKTA
jgi:hypothetical protein